MSGEYGCMTSLFELGPPGPSGIRSHTAFYATRKARERVSDLRVKVNINNPDSRRFAFAKHKAVTEAIRRASGR